MRNWLLIFILLVQFLPANAQSQQRSDSAYLADKRVDKMVETLSVNPYFIGRLHSFLEINRDYSNRLNTITDAETKIARIYDLVRRHLSWNGIDTLYAPRPLYKVWDSRKGNSTEINLVLVKLLQQANFDAEPLIVSTRAHGAVDTNNAKLTDFNRTVAYITFGKRKIILDATARFTDYPMLSAAILNTQGLLISMDVQRWIAVKDDNTYYENNVILLGHFTGDTSFRTNVYVNSSGYSKAERLEKLERDSLRGFRENIFVRGNKNLQLKHFIVANEYVDSLPLAQEFDIRIPFVQSGNFYSIQPVRYVIPDTLFCITDNPKTDLNFGYKQQFSLISEFSFSPKFDLIKLPESIDISSPDGTICFHRECHLGNNTFSQRLLFSIDKSYYKREVTAEVSQFMKRIAGLVKEQVVFKKMY